MGIVIFLVAVLLVPVLMYCAHDTSRLIWGRIHEGQRSGPVSAYRAHLGHVAEPKVHWIEGSPPWIIRVAAFTSFCLGQMIIPAVPGAIFFLVLTVARAIEGPVDPGLIGLGLFMPSTTPNCLAPSTSAIRMRENRSSCSMSRSSLRAPIPC